MFMPESKADRRHRLLEVGFDRWYAQPQPIRFYLWVFWLHLVPLLRVYFRITAWLWRRRINRRIQGFTTFTIPPVRGKLAEFDLINTLVSVQPMTKEAGEIFYIRYRQGPEPTKPRTRQASGWLWGIVIWETI